MLSCRAKTLGPLWIHKDNEGKLLNSHVDNLIFRNITNRHRGGIYEAEDLNEEKQRQIERKLLDKTTKDASSLVSKSVLLDVTNCHQKSDATIIVKSKNTTETKMQLKKLKEKSKKAQASGHHLSIDVFQDSTNCLGNRIKGMSPSEDVNKRKAELERLRRRSLTKENSTRLRNAESPIDLKSNDFAERQQKSLKLEKAKLQEARIYLSNYRADGSELNVNEFTKRQRQSLQLEKAKLQEARAYLSKYQADGKELNNFAGRRRKSLQFEKTKLQEAKKFLNSYRAECIDRKRHSIGSKPSQVPYDENLSTNRILFENKNFDAEKSTKNCNEGQCENPSELSKLLQDDDFSDHLEGDSTKQADDNENIKISIDSNAALVDEYENPVVYVVDETEVAHDPNDDDEAAQICEHINEKDNPYCDDEYDQLYGRANENDCFTCTVM